MSNGTGYFDVVIDLRNGEIFVVWNFDREQTNNCSSTQGMIGLRDSFTPVSLESTFAKEEARNLTEVLEGKNHSTI